MGLNMKTYANYDEFKAFDRELRENGKKLSDEFLSHVKSALTFFHDAGNHNIQIINDVLDTASAMRLQRNRIVDWLAGLVGHEVGKLQGGKFGFMKKLENVEYAEIVANAAEHFEQFPDWYAFKPEQAPEEYNAINAIQKLIKKLTKEAEKASEHHYSALAETIEAFKKSLEVAPIVPDEVEDEPVAEAA